MKKYLKLLLVALLVFMPITFASAKKTTTTTATTTTNTDKINMYVFYGDGCPHCADLETFIKNNLKKDSRVNNIINVIYYETWYNDTNQTVLSAVGQALGVEVKGVPFVVIGDQYFSGYGETMNEEIVSTIQKVKEKSNYVDVVANVVAQTKITPVESNPETGVASTENEKDDSKKNDVIGIIILGVTVVIILAIIFTKHSDDSEDEEDSEDDDEEEIEEDEDEDDDDEEVEEDENEDEDESDDEEDEEVVEEKEEKKPAKKAASTKKKASKKKRK